MNSSPKESNLDILTDVVVDILEIGSNQNQVEMAKKYYYEEDRKNKKITTIISAICIAMLILKFVIL